MTVIRGHIIVINSRDIYIYMLTLRRAAAIIAATTAVPLFSTAGILGITYTLSSRFYASHTMSVPLAPAQDEEDVWKYPRPPALQKTPNKLQVIWTDLQGNETIIAETSDAYRVLETSHPPTYYLSPDSMKIPISTTAKHSFCEWKGSASYHSITPPGAKSAIQNRIWSYPDPTPGFKPIKDYLSFYAASGQNKEAIGGDWRCFVDGEQVAAQDGDFYGGWKTKNIKGKMKGGPGTWGW